MGSGSRGKKNGVISGGVGGGDDPIYQLDFAPELVSKAERGVASCPRCGASFAETRRGRAHKLCGVCRGRSSVAYQASANLERTSVIDDGNFITATTVPAHLAERPEVRRQKALYSLAPLGEMQVGQNWSNWRKSGYLPASLALTAIELVVDHTRLDAGARTDIVVDRLTDAVAASKSERRREEQRRLAKSILDTLLNEQGGRHDREFCYLAPSDQSDGVTTTRLGRVWLLRTEIDHDGSEVLHASAEAVNLIVEGLGDPFDDQQAANDTVLNRQLARGDFTAAEAAAEKASRLSKGYAEEIRLLISTAERDVGNVKWDSLWNPLIERTYQHLREQLDVHRRRIEIIPQQTNRSQSEAVQISAAHILSRLEESHQWHARLFQEVSTARQRMRDHVDRQVFALKPSIALVGLHREVLLPVLTLTVDGAFPILDAICAAMLGYSSPCVVHLPSLVDSLLARGQCPRLPAGEPVEDIVLVDELPDFTGYSDQALDAARLVLETVQQEPVRLSTLIQRPAAQPALDVETAADVGDLIVLHSLYAFAPESRFSGSEALDELASAQLRACRDGRQFDTGSFCGDDLLLYRSGSEGTLE
jgi:hypothetical protein